MTSIKSNQDLYKVINDLIKILKASGNNTHAQKLDTALYISNVAGEILGQLRFELQALIRDRKLCENLGIEKTVNEAIDVLNSIL